jgi:hypothetical protein
VGEPGHFSLFGTNPTFNKLAGYFYGQKLQALKDPRMPLIESRVEDLSVQWDSAKDEREIARLERELLRAVNEHIGLTHFYHERLDAEGKKLRRKGAVLAILAVSSFIVLCLLVFWRTFIIESG